ncbi:MAG: hypothetical protein OEW00_10400 [candidate division Zixibacteria bacterium]|nr:hypothetical protein [candidate division Zixibacteria bacterium]
MSNHWRRRDLDGAKQFNRRRKKAGQFYKHEEDDHDEGRAGRKTRQRGRQKLHQHWQTSWEDEATDDAGEDEEVTG